MKHVRILVYLTVALLVTGQSVASAALAACRCDTPASVQTPLEKQPMPCHEAADAASVQPNAAPDSTPDSGIKACGCDCAHFIKMTPFPTSDLPTVPVGVQAHQGAVSSYHPHLPDTPYIPPRA